MSSVWVNVVCVIVIWLMGISTGWHFHAIVLRRTTQRRRDEASQFGVGDTVTFGDGSYVVVESNAPPKRSTTK